MQSDLAYGPHPRHRLDFYPAGPNAPLVIYIHGGAFMMGDKANPDWGDPESIASLRAGGLAVASLNYRFSSHAIWPAQLDDLKAAVQWLRERAGELNFDASRMASFGPSAGGHLAVCLAIALAQDPKTALRATAAWFPPVDFIHMDADMEASGTPREQVPNIGAESPEDLLIGAPVKSNPELARAASPLGLLDALPADCVLPPFFLQHGALDGLVAARQSQRLQQALLAQGVECALEILPEGTHGHGTFDDPATMARATQFLKSHLEA